MKNNSTLDLTNTVKFGVECGHDKYDILADKDSMPNVIIPIKNPEENLEEIHTDFFDGKDWNTPYYPGKKNTKARMTYNGKSVEIDIDKYDEIFSTDNEYEKFLVENFGGIQPFALPIEGDILKISKTGRAQVILFKQKDSNEFDGVYYLNGNEGCFKPDYTANNSDIMAKEWNMEETEAEEFSELMDKYNICM